MSRDSISLQLFLGPLFLSFSLGSSVSVIGSFLKPTIPSWMCFIDGFTLTLNSISQVNQNNVEICSLQNIVIKSTPSNLTVVASATFDGPFLFDHVQYALSASTILDTATVVVDVFNDQIHYDSGWSKLGSTGMEMSVQNALMTFDFMGAFCLEASNISSKKSSMQVSQ